MAKIAKKIMLICCSFLFVFCLGIGGLLGLNTTSAKAATTTANFVGIYSDGTTTYNMVEAPTKPGRYMIALEYDQVLNAEATASLTLSDVSVKLNGKGMKNFLIRNSNNIANTKIVEVMFNTWTTPGTSYTSDDSITSSNMPVGTQLEVSGSANGYTLETVTLYYNGTNWQEADPNSDTANFVGIYSDGTTTYNMVEAPTKPGRYMIALEYDQVLNAEATASLTLSDVSVKLNGKGIKNFLIRNSNNIANTKIVEVMFNTWTTPGTSYTSDDSITSSNMPVGTQLEVSGSANGYMLETVTLYYNGTNWQDTMPTLPVEFDSFAENNTTSGPYVLTDLKFTNATFSGNFIWDGTPESGYENLSENIYWTSYGNTEKNAFKFIFSVNGNLRLMDTTNFPTAYATITIVEGTTLGEIVLPECKFYVAEDGTWTTTEQKPSIEFKGFTVNNADFSTSWQITTLEFSNTSFVAGKQYVQSGAEDSTATGISQKIYWTAYGSTEKHSFQFIWGGSATQLQLIDEDAKFPTAYATITIEEGATLGTVTLPAVTLYVDAGGRWVTAPPVKFSSFSSNVAFSSPYTYTDLVFTNATLTTQYVTGLTCSENYAGLNEKIYWTANGSTTKNAFGYVWGMGGGTLRLMCGREATFPTTYATITIEEGTTLDGYVFPECKFYVGADGNWTTTQPTVMTGVETGTNSVSIKFSTVISAAGTTATLNGLTATNGVTVTGASAEAGSNVLTLTYDSLPSFGENLLQITLTLATQTAYGDVKLEPFTLYYNDLTSAWQTNEYTYDPTAVEAAFVKIAFSNATIVNIEFDQDIASNDAQLALHSDANCKLTTAMTLDGSTISGLQLLVNSPYGGGAARNHLEIFLSATPAHAAHLHIPAGAYIKSRLVVAADINLYYNAETNAWQTEKPAPIVNGFSTVEGGSIRIDSENGGLRFETYIEKATYESLVATYGKENLKIGTYILPEAWLTLSGRTLEDYVTTYAADGGYYMDISTWNATAGDFGFANSDSEGNITDGNSYYKYYGTIANVKVENYLENFIGVGYLWIKDREDEEYLYLTHDGSWSRNVYEIAKEAYKDTTGVEDGKLWGITPYFDKVIEISTDGSAENTLVVGLDSVLTARPSYSYTKPTDYRVTVENDVIKIVSTSNAVYNVRINGEKAGVMEANTTAYADYYAVTPKLFATAEEAKILNFGFAEPNRNLYSQDGTGFEPINNGATNVNSTASNIAKVTAEFDGNSARIWFQTADLCWNSSNDNTVILGESCLSELKQVISDFRAQGVTNIILMSSVANTRQTKNYYNSTDNKWYNYWDVFNNNYSYDGLSLGLVVLPDDNGDGTISTDESTEYTNFLALQKEYFYQLALAVGNTVTAIEILNEMEGATNYRYSYENTVTVTEGDNEVTYKVLPKIELIAQAAMDICKAATDGVKEAGKNIKIAMPALMTVSKLEKGGKVIRYESKAFAEAEYTYIKESGTGNADDYFQIINMHPYVVLSSATSSTNYLYYEKDGLTVQTPAEIKKRWVEYMNGMRAVFVANGDAEKPVWITEFGLADYNGDCATQINTNKWSDYKNNKLLRQAQVYQSIYDAIMEMPYIDTVLFFRLGDYTHSEHSDLGVCGEATYGVIDASGNLKTFGKYLYAIANGVNVFTDSNYTTLKSTNVLGTINGKTVTDLETNVNNIY